MASTEKASNLRPIISSVAKAPDGTPDSAGSNIIGYAPATNFMSLPPEIHDMIFRLILVLSKPIEPIHQYSTASLRDKVLKFPQYYEETDSMRASNGRIRCRLIHKEENKILELEPKPSILSILAVSKYFNQLGMPLFYKQNTFVFEYCSDLLRFRRHIGHNRYAQIRKITLGFSNHDRYEYRCLLKEPDRLRLCHLHLKVKSSHVGLLSSHGLRGSSVMKELSTWRGLKTLEVTGTDKVNGQVVDANHETAVGPWLRNLVTRPHQDDLKEEREVKKLIEKEQKERLKKWAKVGREVLKSNQKKAKERLIKENKEKVKRLASEQATTRKHLSRAAANEIRPLE